MKQKDFCDEHTKTSGSSYLADQLADLPPTYWFKASWENFFYLINIIVLWDYLAAIVDSLRK